MSGGHFDYKQHHLLDIRDEINHLIATNESTVRNDLGECEGGFLAPETIKKFKEVVEYLNKAYDMVHRIDWLVCADDSEETFHEKWPR